MSTPNRLSGADFQAVYDQAVASAGTPQGPFPSPADWRDHMIYFLMVDRFNNPAAAPAHLPFDDPGFAGFQGGKYSGVQQQLHYIKALGAGAVWLSPVLENMPFEAGSYHGYGIHDFLRAERRFADDPARADDELRALVDAAHQAGLYVIFDIVLNHVGDVFAYVCASADQVCQATQGAEAALSATPMTVMWHAPDGSSPAGDNDVAGIVPPSRDALVWPAELQHNAFFRRQGKSGADGDTVGDFDSLKQMMTADPDLQNFLIRAYQYVVARFDVDGFRIDTLRYLQGDLPRLFGNAMREFALSIGKKNFFTFGEVLDGSAETDIARFIGRNTCDGSDLVGVDAALDYPLFNVLKSTVKGFNPPSSVVAMYNARKTVERDVLSSHGDATRFFVTFLDNHDMKERMRFIDAAAQQAQDDEVTLGLGCLLSLPGVPCLYYGTEQGLHGHGSQDPAVREALWGGPGFQASNQFYVAIQAMTTIRAGQAALRYGRFYFRPVSGDGEEFGPSQFMNGVLAFSRILNDAEIVVVANINKTDPISVHVIVDDALNPIGKQMQVLFSNKPAPSPARSVVGRSNVIVHEVDGTTGSGPLRTVQVTLQPTEVQILR